MRQILFFLKWIPDLWRNHSRSESLPLISNQTTLEKLLKHYPHFESFLQGRYHVHLNPADRWRRLDSFCLRKQLPLPEILFMEFQLTQRTKVLSLSPKQVSQQLKTDQEVILLDAREDWERQWGALPRSTPLSGSFLHDLVHHGNRDRAITVYCHFGVRSFDVATYLEDQGFKKVNVLAGGTEAWSLQIDPNFPRYPGHPC